MKGIAPTLESIQQFFQKEELTCEIVKANKDFPIDQLFVRLDVDNEGRDITLQLKLTEHDLSTEEAAIPYHQLQFFLGLPFLVTAETNTETARLLHLINKSLELPGFEYSEVDGLVYYRHVLTLPTKGIPVTLLMSMLGMIMFLHDSFAVVIESVANGSKTLEEMSQLGLNLTSADP